MAGNALYLARHRINYDLIVDILTRDLLPLLSRSKAVSSSSAIAVLQEVAGVFAEHGELAEAEAAYSQIDKLTVLAGPITDKRVAAAILRKEGGILGARVGLRPAVRALLRDALEISLFDANMIVSVVNTEAWLLLDARQYKQALDLLAPYYDRHIAALSQPDVRAATVAMTIWNAAELIHNYAVALTHARPNRWRRKRKEALDVAARLYQQAGARLFMIKADYQVDRELTDTEQARLSLPLPSPLPQAVRGALLNVGRLACQRAGLM